MLIILLSSKAKWLAQMISVNVVGHLVSFMAVGIRFESPLARHNSLHWWVYYDAFHNCGKDPLGHPMMFSLRKILWSLEHKNKPWLGIFFLIIIIISFMKPNLVFSRVIHNCGKHPLGYHIMFSLQKILLSLEYKNKPWLEIFIY